MQDRSNQARYRQDQRNKPGVLAAFLETALQQVFGRRTDRQNGFWRAYTRSGKIVVIQDRQVVDIIDPKHVPDR